jgi:hypothetical protein
MRALVIHGTHLDCELEHNRVYIKHGHCYVTQISNTLKKGLFNVHIQDVTIFFLNKYKLLIVKKTTEAEYSGKLARR